MQDSAEGSSGATPTDDIELVERPVMPVDDTASEGYTTAVEPVVMPVAFVTTDASDTGEGSIHSISPVIPRGTARAVDDEYVISSFVDRSQIVPLPPAPVDNSQPGKKCILAIHRSLHQDTGK